MTVTTTADSGPGSLRQLLAGLPAGGSVSLRAGARRPDHRASTSGPLVLVEGRRPSTPRPRPGSTLSGNGADRVFIVNAGTTAASCARLTVANGFGFDLAGGILNNGSLDARRLHRARQPRGRGHATSSGRAAAASTAATAARSSLRRQHVRGNTTQLVDGGGVYAFFGATVTVERSTIEGNTAGNVGGGIRSLGNVTLTNSTLSGNTSTAWYGGAVFHTDGVMELAELDGDRQRVASGAARRRSSSARSRPRARRSD